MRIVCIFALVVSAALVGGCASGESYVQAGYDFSGLNKVAVIEVVGAIKGDPAKNQIGDFFGMELLKKGYTVVERAQVQTLLKEQEFQASDITTAEGAAKAGRILNVPAALIVNIPTYKEQIEMTAKIVDVEDASVVWMGSGSGSTGKTLSTIAGAAAGAAVGAVVGGGDSRDRVAGGVIGGVLGGIAGHALSPQQAKQCRKIIGKVCNTLPYRLAKQ